MYPATPLKKALCVGISYKGQLGPYGVPPKDFELSGAHNDVWKVRDLLTGCYGYEDSKITILLDADGFTSPTRNNILGAMNELVAGAKPGENLFFFFAGHGDQITNHDGSEDDMKDEIILPLDWELDETLQVEDRERYKVKIIDDEMNDILVKCLPPDCRLTALFDSCHSGTLLDLPYSRSYGPRSRSSSVDQYLAMGPRTESPEPSRPLARRAPRETQVIYDIPEGKLPSQAQTQTQPQSPEEIARINHAVGRGPLDLSYTCARVAQGRMGPRWRKGTWIFRGETLDDKVKPFGGGHHAISWSACSDAQIGYEIHSIHENRSGGVMVEAFVGILKARPYRTYSDILRSLGDRLKETCGKINANRPESEWIIQEPQLGSQHKPDLEKLFAP